MSNKMLPDERDVIESRIHLLDDPERRLSLDEVAENLGFER